MHVDICQGQLSRTVLQLTTGSDQLYYVTLILKFLTPHACRAMASGRTPRGDWLQYAMIVGPAGRAPGSVYQYDPPTGRGCLLNIRIFNHVIESALICREVS